MAGTLIVSNLTTDTDNTFIVRSNTGTTLFIANTTGIDVANSIAATSITSDKILSVANTKITGNIISSQIAPNLTLYGNTSITSVTGNLNIGTTTQVGAEKVGISFDDTVYNGLGIQVQGSASSAGYTVFRNSSGSAIGTISRNGTGSSVKFNTTSDSSGAYLLNSGVAFPATQVASADANTLYDYREGSYTGTLTGCTKIGRAHV